MQQSQSAKIINLASTVKCGADGQWRQRLLDESLQKRLNQEPWDDHIEKLTLYAQNRIRRLNFRGVANGAIPGGKLAADFALEAICDVYGGTRKWNPDTHPDILKYLFAVVKSKISNVVTSKSNQELRDDPNRPDASKSDDDTALEILDYVKDDADLCRYAEAIIDGYEDRKDIADHLDIKASDVDNLRKRMGRRLDAYYKETNTNGKAR